MFSNSYVRHAKAGKGDFADWKALARPGHGIGLESIRRTAEKNGGIATIDASDSNVFVLTVALPITGTSTINSAEPVREPKVNAHDREMELEQ